MTDYQHLLRPRTSKVVQDASFFRRATAFIIDILLLDFIVTAPFTPVFLPLLSRIEQTGILAVTYTTREAAAMIMLFLLIYLYFVVFEYVLGQTIGMMILKTNVKSGTRLWQHLLRNSFLFPVFPFVFFWVIEPLSILFFRRGVLEHLSNTRTLYQQRIII